MIEFLLDLGEAVFVLIPLIVISCAVLVGLAIGFDRVLRRIFDQ